MRNFFLQKYVREILCCFRIFRQIHFCKFRNFAKKFANCERTFSHFFSKVFVRWKPYFKEKVDNRLFFLQIRLDTYYNGRKETWGRLRWKKGGWTPNGNFYSDLTLNWIGVGPSCPVHLKLKQAYNFCSHRHWRHSLTINTTSNPPQVVFTKTFALDDFTNGIKLFPVCLSQEPWILSSSCQACKHSFQMSQTLFQSPWSLSQMFTSRH